MVGGLYAESFAIDGYTRIVYTFTKNGGQLTEKDVSYSVQMSIRDRVVHSRDLTSRSCGVRPR